MCTHSFESFWRRVIWVLCVADFLALILLFLCHSQPGFKEAFMGLMVTTVTVFFLFILHSLCVLEYWEYVAPTTRRSSNAYSSPLDTPPASRRGRSARVSANPGRAQDVMVV